MKKEIRQIRFSSLQVSFPRKIIYSRFFYSSPSIPPKAIKSNSESGAENQFLIKKKKQSAGNRASVLQLRETSRGGCLAARLQPGLRLAGRESGGAGGPRGCVCLSIHAESSLSQVRVTPVSGCGDSTRGLTDPLPGRGAPNPVSIPPGNLENGPARTSQAVCSTPRSPLQEFHAAVTAVQAARSRAWPRLPGGSIHEPGSGQSTQPSGLWGPREFNPRSPA